MAAKNQSITVTYYAWNTSSNAYQTGDAANHTLKLLKDGTEASPTNSNAEVDSTNAPGVYSLALTSAECGFNTVDIMGKSSTSNVVLIGKTYLFDNVPVFAIGTQGGLLTVGSGAGQINVTSGFANANVQQWEGLPPSALQSGLVQAAIVSGAATSVLGSVGSVTSGVNVTQWTAIAVASGVGGFPQVAVVSGFANANVTQWLGSAPNTLQNGLVQVALLSGATTGGNVTSWGGVNVGTIPPDSIFTTSGTAQSGASSTTITLASGTLGTDNTYQNQTIFIRTGGGAGESANISTYTAATKVATIVGTWAIQPGSGSGYTIVSLGPVAATVGGTVSANVIQVGGTNITSASGFLQTNVTQINGIAPTIEADGRLTVAVVSGLVNANLTQWEGTAPNALQNGLVQASTVSGAATSVLGSVASVTSGVNVTQWNAIAVASTVGGGFIQAAMVSGAATSVLGNVAGSVNSVVTIVTANATQIAGVATVTSLALGNVNVVNWQGTGPNTLQNGLVQASVVSGAISSVLTTVNANVTQAGGTNITANSGLLQVNVTQVSGIGPMINSDGRIQTDLRTWLGSAPSALQAGLVQADVEQWKAVAPNTLISGRVDVNVGQMQANSIQTSTFNASALATTVFASNFLTSALVDSTTDNAIADALLDRSNAIETGLTPRQAWRLDAAAAGGVTSGAGTTGFHILGAGVSTARVSATTDQSGNRLSVTLTL